MGLDIKKNSLLISLLISSLFAKEFVAVLELDPIGLTEEEGHILTQRLSSEFINSREYSVIALDKVKKILRKKRYKNYVDFHQYCIEKECAVNIGKIVTADYIVIGSVSKLDSAYKVDVKMIDVQNNNIVSTSIYNHVGEIEILLSEGIVSIARELSPTPPQSPSPSKEIYEIAGNEVGHIFIDSSPKGADVFIDDKYFSKTPMESFDSPLGMHKIMLQLNDYDNYSEIINVRLQDTSYVNAQLNKSTYGYLDFYVFPENSNVLINNLPLDAYSIYSNVSNDSQIYSLKIGKYDIVASKSFYKPIKEHVKIEEGLNTTVEFYLKKKSLLKATMLECLFPGFGHYYSGEKRKGFVIYFAGLISFSSILMMSDVYTRENAKYEDANKAYLAATEKNDILNKYDLLQHAWENKNNATINLVSYSSVAFALWTWDIISLRHYIKKEYYNPEKMDFGINNIGQLELQIAF